MIDFILFLSCKSQINSPYETYEISYEIRYKSTFVPSAFFARCETCFHVRGWMGYSRGREGVSASCRKNYMIAGNARAFPPSTLFCSFPSSFGLENMISFVPGSLFGGNGRVGNGKRGGGRSYPSDFMDDHGPLTRLDTTTLSMKRSLRCYI